MKQTLTVDESYTKDDCMKLSGVTFYFSRGFDNEGMWFHAERVGQSPANSMAPMMLQQDLSSMARASGMSELHNFSRYPAKPEPAPKGPRGPRKTTKKESPLMAGFNPFAV